MSFTIFISFFTILKLYFYKNRVILMLRGQALDYFDKLKIFTFMDMTNERKHSKTSE